MSYKPGLIKKGCVNKKCRTPESDDPDNRVLSMAFHNRTKRKQLNIGRTNSLKGRLIKDYTTCHRGMISFSLSVQICSTEVKREGTLSEEGGATST